MAPADLRAAILSARNADGGWGYRPGNTSRLEPTCWALLALARADGRPTDIDVFLKWPTENQWLVDAPGAPYNITFNALAALTLLTREQGQPAALNLLHLILAAKGRRLEQAAAFRQNNSLQAWPWVDGTFSWVEPSAWCLLLVKKMRTQSGADGRERIGVAENMLRDRACRDGGWNYGSSNVYGQELYPYITTTAIGVIAMQDQPSDAVVSHAVAYLEKDFATEATPVALALTTIALSLQRRPIAAPQALLLKRAKELTASTSTVGRAMTLYALSNSSDDHGAFKI